MLQKERAGANPFNLNPASQVHPTLRNIWGFFHTWCQHLGGFFFTFVILCPLRSRVRSLLHSFHHIPRYITIKCRILCSMAEDRRGKLHVSIFSLAVKSRSGDGVLFWYSAITLSRSHQMRKANVRPQNRGIFESVRCVGMYFLCKWSWIFVRYLLWCCWDSGRWNVVWWSHEIGFVVWYWMVVENKNNQKVEDVMILEVVKCLNEGRSVVLEGR